MEIYDYCDIMNRNKLPETHDVDFWGDPLELALCFTTGIAVCLVAEVLVAIWLGIRIVLG